MLLVEDEDDLRELEEVVLSAEGARVVATGSAHGALEELGRNAAFDVVVTDLSLPELDGYELCARIRDVCPELPVIALTGLVGPSERARALAHGFALHVPKPASPEELVHAVHVTTRDVPGGR